VVYGATNRTGKNLKEFSAKIFFPKVSSIPYSPEASTGLSSHPQKFPDSSPFLLHKSHQPPQSLRRGIVEILFPTLKDQ
jgi:hypothetical protein